MSKNKKKKFQPISLSASPKKKTETSSPISNFLESNNFYLLLLGIVVLWVSIIRWRFVGMPLERDEGEYAYMGQLILKGITPYTEAYNMKLPGIYYMYALIMAIFGESYRGIHIGFLFMNAGTMILLFFSLKRFFNPLTGILTAGFYGLMAMSMNVLGFAAHATHFAVFFISLALFFFSKFEESKKILFAFLTGTMLGMAFLMKQQAVYFILFGGIVFVVFQMLDAGRDFKSRPTIFQIIKGTSIFSLGVFIPYIIVLLIMLATGTFDKFWFWTVQYAGKYASGLPWESGKDLLNMTFSPIWEENKWIWILALIGIVLTLFTRFSLKQKILAISFAVFGCMATTPGFYFRQHYFVVALPAVALLAGITLDFAGRFISEKIKMKAIGIALPLVILFFLFNITLSKSKGYYSTDNPIMLCKAIYGTNPFIESVDIAKYIKENSSDTDKIAVLGSEPQIPFYAGRKSATGHIYTYGLMEIHDYNLKMQEEMISEIEKAKPLYLVFVNVPFSWLSKPDSPKRIFEWYNKYATENYTIVGLVDIPDQGLSSFYWNADAQRQPKNQNSVWIFKRKDKS
ncbi:MAG: glycosyltransferase family 39 protein [Bacteroidetes bacterium]|nr:glycosyltransferase family 39 protein [Bacteroidota bacterium]